MCLQSNSHRAPRGQRATPPLSWQGRRWWRQTHGRRQSRPVVPGPPPPEPPALHSRARGPRGTGPCVESVRLIGSLSCSAPNRTEPGRLPYSREFGGSAPDAVDRRGRLGGPQRGCARCPEGRRDRTDRVCRCGPLLGHVVIHPVVLVDSQGQRLVARGLGGERGLPGGWHLACLRVRAGAGMQVGQSPRLPGAVSRSGGLCDYRCCCPPWRRQVWPVDRAVRLRGLVAVRLQVGLEAADAFV